MPVCELTFDLGVSLQLDGVDLLDTPGEPQSAFYEGSGVSARPRDTPAGSGRWADTAVRGGDHPSTGPIPRPGLAWQWGQGQPLLPEAVAPATSCPHMQTPPSACLLTGPRLGPPCVTVTIFDRAFRGAQEIWGPGSARDQTRLGHAPGWYSHCLTSQPQFRVLL